MAPATGEKKQWYSGTVKGVLSGDCILIMGKSPTPDTLPSEKTLTLSGVMAPRLARKGGTDESFAWESREFLGNLCLGKQITFCVDWVLNPSTNPVIGTVIPPREFGTVFLGSKNLSMEVVAAGWAKVKEQKDGNPGYIGELKKLEEAAIAQGLGRWTKEAGAAERAIRDLPPSAIGGESKSFDAGSFLSENKGKSLKAFVEQVRDGSTLRVYLLADFQFVQVFVGGIQSPSPGRRVTPTETVPAPEVSAEERNGDAETSSTMTSAQRLAASTAATEIQPDSFGKEAKHFTEVRVLNREVLVVLEGCDKYGNLVGSVFYQQGDSAKDLGLELVENGFAKYIEWSASMLEDEAKRRLKNAELQAKKNRLRIWKNYVPPPSNSKPIRDDKFNGTVIEVVSGDCIVVADDNGPADSLLAERRVNLSSIRAPKMGNPRRDEKPAAYAREAKEFLRGKLIGQRVYVMMEYSRKVPISDGPAAAAPANADSRNMDFGSVFLLSTAKADMEGVTPSISASALAQPKDSVNVAELIVLKGYATVIRHREFEERSNFYDALIQAESKANKNNKGIHSSRDPPPMHSNAAAPSSLKAARNLFDMLRKRKHVALVEYVLSGHRFKINLPKELCAVTFAFSGVRCPGRGEPYSDEAIAFMRRRVLQREVEVSFVEQDKSGAFLGAMWDSKTNLAIPLLESGFAKLQQFFSDKTPDSHLLFQAEEKARNARLKVWENYEEEKEVANGSTTVQDNRSKKTLQAVVTDVLETGQFYIQTANDSRFKSIQQQIEKLNISDSPPPAAAFHPKKNDVVLSWFAADKSWNRAMIMNAPRQGTVLSDNDLFHVFYIDYGNEDSVPISSLRPLDGSLSSDNGVALLCSLAFLKLPTDEDSAREAAEFIWQRTIEKELKVVVEEEDHTGGKVKGRGLGHVLKVSLYEPESEVSINAAMLEEGLARLEKKQRRDSREKITALENLEKYQEKAKKERKNIWQYGDIESDDDEEVSGTGRRNGRR